MSLIKCLKWLSLGVLLFALAGCNGMVIPVNGGGGSYPGPTPAPHALPAGNYTHTCNLCEMRGRTLSCMCKDQHGFPQQTALRVGWNCRFVQNIGGHLRCTQQHHRSWLPRGNYQQTCSNCAMYRNSLICTCKNGHGFTTRTRLPDASYCRYVQNVDGNLRCTG